MSDYVINPISSNKGYDLWGIKLANGTKSIFYKKEKSVTPISTISITFNNKKAVAVKDGELCISLSGVSRFEDMVKIVKIVTSEFKISIRNIKFKFVVDNDKDLEIANLFLANGLNAVIEKTVEYEQNSVNVKANSTKKEEVISDIEMVGNRTVENFDGKKYTELSDGNMVANLGYLNNNEKLKILFNEFLSVPENNRKFTSGELTREQIMVELERRLQVENNLKSYDMKASNSENVINDDSSKMRDSYAAHVSGTYNNDLGIVRDDQGRFQTVDDAGNVRQANVETATYSGTGISGSSTSSSSVSQVSDSSSGNEDAVSYMEEEEQEEKELGEMTIFYMDEAGYIYDHNSVVVGKNYDGCYLVNENNNLLKDGALVGVIDDVRNMGKKQQFDKPKVHVREKPKENGGFVNLPIIIFVISFLLLVGSGIILFIMK